MEIKNDLILRAARGEETERTPVWLMRQAGRILPEYRAVRKKLGGFIDLVKNPALCAEVTVQPVDILDVDAAIIFSDILVIPEAMGLPYELVEKKGPLFPKTITREEDIANLITPDPEEHLGYVLEAIRLTKRELNGRVPLIGFAGAPWTIFCYMIEGQGSKTFSKSRKFLYQHPDLSHQLLQKITDSTISYLKAQIKQGADLVQVFDSWAGILPKYQFETFALPYISKICDAIDEVPVTAFAKGANFSLSEMGKLDCQTIGLDWNVEPEFARMQVGERKTLQGNLDPCVLYAGYKEVESATRKMLDSFGHNRHIANLGHGVYPDIEADKVKCFIETVKSYKA